MHKLWFALLCFMVLDATAQPIDPEATPETVHLFHNLRELAKGNLLLGHEDALAYGLNEDGTRWIDEDNRSDVKSVTGSHPAVYGWEIGRLELEDSAANIDDVNFERMKYWIRTGYERGGIITISWHANNPATGGDTWDTGGRAVSTILPGGDQHDLFVGWLDRVADFALDLKDSKGEFIPVLFRPYHEHTGSWFWWGKNHCTVEEYIALWKFTVDYFRIERGIHHFLYSYSPSNSGVNSENDYLERYPGDDYVDLLGIDDYGNIYRDSQKAAFLKLLRIAVNLANERGKVSALTETGNERIPDGTWFTDHIVEPIKSDPIARQIAYFLVWRNGRPDHYYAPYPGHRAADDLASIAQDPYVLLENSLPSLYIPNEVTIVQLLPDVGLAAKSDSVVSLDLDQYFSAETELSYSLVYESDPDLAEVQVEERHYLTLMAGANEGQSVFRIQAETGSGNAREMMFLLDLSPEEKVVSALTDTVARNLRIYPNPFTTEIQLESPITFSHYSLRDIEGKLLVNRETMPKANQLTLSHLGTGVYFLQLHGTTGTVTKRILKR